MRELEPTCSSLEQEKSEQIWRESRMLFTFEAGEGENELPTDIDIDTVFLDYYPNDENENSDSHHEIAQNREVVLVLPGIGMDLEVNKPFLQELAKSGRRVISLSVPGCGDSGDPGKEWRRQDSNNGKEWKYNFSNYSALLNRLLDKLREQGKIGKDEKIRVIGHSLGGAMGAEFVANNSKQVSALDLIAPGGYRKVEPNFTHLHLGTTLDFIHKQGKETIERIKSQGLKEGSVFFRRMWVNNFTKKDNKFNWAKLDEENAGSLPRTLQRLWEVEVVLQANLEDDMQQAVSNNVPIKILVGEKDGLLPPNEYEEIVQRLQSLGLQIVLKEIPGAGHYGPVTKSKDFVDAL